MQLARSETQEQISFIKRAELILTPDFKNFLWGSAAGVRTSPRQAVTAKRMGSRKGIPDVTLMLPRGNFHGLCIEMKRLYPHKGSVKPEQRLMIAELNAEGYSAHIAYGADEAFDILTNYLTLDN